MKISYNRIRCAAVMYAVVPIFIFFFGWLSIFWATVFSGLLAAACFFFYKNSRKRDGEKTYAVISKLMLAIIGIIAFVWCFLAGQGGFVHQSNDHIIRNAIFRDMIKMPWPVVYSDGSMLSYYIAHWMFPALLGKIFYAVSGSVSLGYAAGNVFLLIWSSIGVFLVLLLTVILTYSKKKSHILLAVFMFIFFSGLDFVGATVFKHRTDHHFEWWALYMQYSSITTCIFWVYNQTIAIWLITLCIINERSCKNFAFLGLLALPFGPLPFIGIVMMCVIKAAVISVRHIRKGQIIKLKNILSLQNILPCISILPVYYLYYFSNAIVSNDVGLNGINYKTPQLNTGFRLNEFFLNPIIERNIPVSIYMIRLYIAFIVIEFGIYAAIILIYKKKNKEKIAPEFIGTIILLLLMPLFRLGTAGDFTMRASIPPIVYIAVEFIKTFIELINQKKKITNFNGFILKNVCIVIISFIFILGAVTPATEFHREISLTLSGVDTIADRREKESMDEVESKDNFVAKNYTRSTFYKYICKK